MLETQTKAVVCSRSFMNVPISQSHAYKRAIMHCQLSEPRTLIRHIQGGILPNRATFPPLTPPFGFDAFACHFATRFLFIYLSVDFVTLPSSSNFLFTF